MPFVYLLKVFGLNPGMEQLYDFEKYTSDKDI